MNQKYFSLKSHEIHGQVKHLSSGCCIDAHQWPHHLPAIEPQLWAETLHASMVFTLPETNSESPWKWMVGILLSYWGPAYFQGRAVSFREGTVFLLHLFTKPRQYSIAKRFKPESFGYFGRIPRSIFYRASLGEVVTMEKFESYCWWKKSG